MTIVYATGQPRFFEFATTTSEDMLPAGAMIVAICDGMRTTDLLEEYAFERMSDEEYCELQGLIRASQEQECTRPGIGRTNGWLRKFCNLSAIREHISKLMQFARLRRRGEG